MNDFIFIDFKYYTIEFCSETLNDNKLIRTHEIFLNLIIKCVTHAVGVETGCVQQTSSIKMNFHIW